MSHQLLLLQTDERATFPADEVLHALQAIRGVRELKEGVGFGSVIRGVFEFQGDRTTVELSDDQRRISLAGTGVAAMQLALELKDRLKSSLRAVDTAYTFDVKLDAIRDVEDFQNRIRDGEGV